MKSAPKKGKFSKRVKTHRQVGEERLGNPYMDRGTTLGKVGPVNRELFNDYGKDADKRREDMEGFGLFIG